MGVKPRGMMRRFLLLVFLLALLAVPVFASAAFAQGNQVQVSAVDFEFQPKTITINAGDTVLWTNNGLVEHTVTADDSSFDSGLLSPGQTFSHTFDTPGTVPYFCRIHGAPGGVGMSGVIVVQAVSPAPATPTAAPVATQVPVPTEVPTQAPAPTEVPTEVVAPTEVPTQAVAPTEVPTQAVAPTEVPTQAVAPTEVPTLAAAPTETPTPAPPTPQVAAATPPAVPTPTATPAPAVLPSAGEGGDFSLWLMVAAAGLVLAGGLAVRNLAPRE